MDQLTQIMKVTGVPGPEFVQKLDSPEVGHVTVCVLLLINTRFVYNEITVVILNS